MCFCDVYNVNLWEKKLANIFAEFHHFTEVATEGVCIPLGGNIPLRGNSISILFISSERVGIFKFNFAALIQVTIETFWDPYT